MSKPTILQSLLGRPSQTYYFPAAREYHSTKHDLLRSVSPTSLPDLNPSQAIEPMPAGLPINTNGRPLSSTPPSSSGQHSSPSPSVLSPHPTDDLDSMTHSHHGSKSSSSISGPSKPLSRPGTVLTGSTHISHSPAPPVHSPHASTLSRPGHLTSRGVEVDSDVGTTTDDDQDEDVFYTPRSSFISSPRASRSSATMLVDPKALVSALLPSSSLLTSKPALSRQHIHSRGSSESSLSSASSSANSSEADSATSSRATTSTRITTPISSDKSSNRRQNEHAPIQRAETITISSSKSRSNGVGIRVRPKSAVSSLGEQRNRTQNEMRRLTYTDEDWAKDVRWLSPPSHRRADSGDLSSTSARSYNRSSRPQALYPPQAKSADRRQRSSARRSRASRGSRGRMSALLEEDESDSTDVTLGGSSTEISRPPSPALELPASSDSRDASTPTTESPLRTSLARSKSQRSARSSSSAKGIGSLKRTASPEPMQNTDAEADTEAIEALESPDARVEAYARSHRRSYSHTRPLSRSLALTQPSPSQYEKALPTHSLPTPHVSSDSPALNGYSGLTMAHAGYVSKGKTLGDGKIDMVKAGIAQSTMATVEVVFGSAQPSSYSSSPLKKKRRSLSVTFKFLSNKRKEGLTPGHLLQELPLPVAFTAHLPPPSSIQPSHALIQVFAVGLDALDSLLVHDKVGYDRAKAGGNGFIPGRSVVGRVIECGWEVKSDVCKKGDWVIGLLDFRQSGALAEFVVLERHRLHRAPQPRSRPTTLFPSVVNRRSHVRSMSLPSHLHTLPSISGIPVSNYHQLSIEELALLPLNGLFAHRAVRTLADAIVPPRSPGVQEGSEIGAGSSALVLHAHDGPGSMAVQMLSKRGVRVCAQVPTSALRLHTDKRHDDSLDGEALSVNGQAAEALKRNASIKRSLQSPASTVEVRLRAWGAQDVCIGRPVETIEKLAAEGHCFDAVIDTVGGADIWAASQQLLLAVPPHSSGTKNASSHAQFTTLVGDNPLKPIPSAQDNIRSGFRSVRRTINVPPAAECDVDRIGSHDSSSRKKSSTTSLPLSRMHSKNRSVSKSKSVTVKRTVGYAWVSIAADVDYEGEDIRDALGSVVGMVEEGWIQPWIGDDGDSEDGRVVAFDGAPEVFRRDSKGPLGLLRDGGTCVVKVVV